jgi:hypothetical protein
MSNIAVIRQGVEDIQVWDNFGQSENIPLKDGKIIEDEMELLEYVIDYAQGFGCETLVDILDSVCEQGYKMIINTIPYTNEQVMPSFTKMGFWE